MTARLTFNALGLAFAFYMAATHALGLAPWTHTL